MTVADSRPRSITKAAAGHAYTVTAQASDGTLTSSQTFTIAVTDVAPSTPVDANAAANSVAEGAAIGTHGGRHRLVKRHQRSRGDLFADRRYSSGGGFTINSTTGVVVTVGRSQQDRLRERGRPCLHHHRPSQRRHADQQPDFHHRGDRRGAVHPGGQQSPALPVQCGRRCCSRHGGRASRPPRAMSTAQRADLFADPAIRPAAASPSMPPPAW